MLRAPGVEPAAERAKLDAELDAERAELGAERCFSEDQGRRVRSEARVSIWGDGLAESAAPRARGRALSAPAPKGKKRPSIS